jgi:hypothetical protein
MKKWMLLIVLFIGTAIVLRYTPLLTSLMPPDVRLPDNSTYTGELKNGLFHGHGELNWADGSHYVGEFQNGLMHGEGELIEVNGTRQKGQFIDGMMHGQGSIRFADGATYSGEFFQNQMTGEGKMIDAFGYQYEGLFEYGVLVQGTEKDVEGDVREGTFKQGLLEGQGTLASAGGTVYTGEFVAGVLNGKGQIFNDQGLRYEGEIKDWVYSGEGELTDPDGDHYSGSFEYGMFHGQGVLTLAEPINGISEVAGVWEYGFHPEDPREKSWGDFQADAVDDLLYTQNKLLQQQIDELQFNQDGAIDMYFLGAALHNEAVFYRELDFIHEVMIDQFDVQGKSITLYNQPGKMDEKPLATERAIKQSLAGLAEKMDVNHDVLFIYMTSHGDPDELIVHFPGLTLSNLEAQRLRRLLEDSPIRWKVIVVSACYSGSFIDELANENHLIMTAAREDRVSFGCGNGSEMTYFAKALFKESMPLHKSFSAAFGAAQSLVAKWEEEDFPDQERSEPQISMGSSIGAHLKKWRAQFQQ